MEAAGVTRDRQDKGQGVEVDHIVTHIEELRIQTCRDERHSLTLANSESRQIKRKIKRKREQTNIEECKKKNLKTMWVPSSSRTWSDYIC